MKVLTVLSKPFTALAGKVDDTVRERVRMSIIRHVATYAGGVLVASGWLLDAQQADFVNKLAEVIGLGLGLAGMIAGARQKQH